MMDDHGPHTDPRALKLTGRWIVVAALAGLGLVAALCSGCAGGGIKVSDVVSAACNADPTLPVCASATPPPTPPPITCPSEQLLVDGKCMPALPPPPPPDPAQKPTPTPEPPKPAFDPGKDDPEPAVLAAVRTVEDDGAEPDPFFAADVNSAIDVACAGCGSGSQVSDWVQFIKNVRDGMRSRGYLAAYDWKNGDPAPETASVPGLKGLGSELSIWKAGHLEAYQVLTSAKKVRRPPGAFRARAVIVGACPLQLPLPAGYSVGIRVGPYGTTGQGFDATPFLKDDGGAPFPPTTWTGSCRAHQCDFGDEKDRLNGGACTIDLCGEQASYRLEPPGSGFINWIKGYSIKVTMASAGELVASCPKVPGAEARIRP